MNITLEYASPLKEGIVGKFAEDAGLTREPPQKCFKGQLFSQSGTCGRIRIAVTEKRDRIVISTPYSNAHMRSFQLLIIAREATRLGDEPKLTFSQEFAHMDLSRWFPGGKQERNQTHFKGAKLCQKYCILQTRISIWPTTAGRIRKPDFPSG